MVVVADPGQQPASIRPPAVYDAIKHDHRLWIIMELFRAGSSPDIIYAVPSPAWVGQIELRAYRTGWRADHHDGAGCLPDVKSRSERGHDINEGDRLRRFLALRSPLRSQWRLSPLVRRSDRGPY